MEPVKMIRTDHIRSLTDFRQNATQHLDRLAKTRSVEVLTINGEAKGVVMSPKTYDELAEKAMRAEITARIKRGMAEIAEGRGIDAREDMKQIADEFGIKMKR